MEKAIAAARKISKEPEINHLAYLEEINLYKSFEEIYKLNFSIIDANLLVAFIIYAYDPDSQKIDLRKERIDNKTSIAANIGLDVKKENINEILINANEKFNDVVAAYLSELTDWRWQTISTLLDYHANMMKFVNQKTEDERSFDKMNKEGVVKTMKEEYELDTIGKINKQKGELLDLAISAREKADKLLAEIKKDFVHTDTAVQADFNFNFSETSKTKVDIYSWRGWIRERNERNAKKSTV